MSWFYGTHLNTKGNGKMLQGYPNFMQSGTNPMQAGFNWSNLTNADDRKKSVTSETTSLDKALSNMRQQQAMKNEVGGAAADHQGYYTTSPELAAIAPKYDFGNMNPLSLFNLPNHPLGHIIGLPQPWNFSVPDVTSNSRVGLSAITYCTKYCSYGGYTMEFALLSENGPSHNPLFVFCLKIVNPTALKLETVGQGHSKAAAKEDAARHMVTKLIAIFGELPPDMPNKSGEKTTNPRRKAKVKIEDSEWVKVTEAIPGSNAIGMMYGWANRKKIEVPMFNLVKEEAIAPEDRRGLFRNPEFMYTIECSFMGRKFEGKDRLKKKAKLLAATAAWKELRPK